MPRSPLTVEVKDAVGAPVSGASVAVFARHTGAAATIYNAETGGSVIGNPTTTDSAGRATFWADRGDYRADVSGAGIAAYSIPLNATAAAAGTMASPWVQSAILPAASSYGKSIIATNESTASTSYTTLTTPDQVTGIVLPTAGMIGVMYTAIWQATVVSNARAAIFLGSNQLKLPAQTTPGLAVEGAGSNPINDDDFLGSYGAGLTQLNGAGAATQVTTGETVSPPSNSSICWILASAGTYTVSIRFKNVAAGTLSVKNRKLWVFSPSFVLG